MEAGTPRPNKELYSRGLVEWYATLVTGRPAQYTSNPVDISLVEQTLGDRREALHAARLNTSNCLRRFRSAQEKWLAEDRAGLGRGQTDAVRQQFESLAVRFLLASTHLEELWAHSSSRRLQILELVEPVETHTWSNDDLLESMLVFEGYLFQLRSFVDYFLVYACLTFGVSAPGTMRLRDFRRRVQRLGLPRGDRFLLYVEQEVFGDAAWGSLLRSLRDRVAHRAAFQPSREGKEEVLGVRLDWPTIRGHTLERLAQTFDNGAFGLISDSVPILFGREWVTGQARDT